MVTFYFSADIYKMGEGELVVKSQSVDTGLRMGEDQGKS